MFGQQNRFFTLIGGVALIALPHINAIGQEAESAADQRMQLMQTRALAIKFDSDVDGFPESLSPKPLFRYDDVTRGYVDGAIWRLGDHGRPRVIISTELHRNFFGAGPKIIYEFLSLTDQTFQAGSKDFTRWMPDGSESTMKTIKQTPTPAQSPVRRLQQMRVIANRFSAMQIVEGQKIQLRRLPQPIGRYDESKQPNDDELNEEPDATGSDESQIDGAIFVFASGRMPGLLLMIESDGKKWQYGVGRLSRPSELVVSLDGDQVWARVPTSRSWSSPFTSTNAPAKVP